MESRNAAKANETAGQLVELLKSIRESNAQRSEEERRSALQDALRDALANVQPAEAEAVLDLAREMVVREAREREARLLQLSSDLASQVEEASALRKERDRLVSEITGLKAAQAPAASPEPLPGDSSLDRLLAEMPKLAAGAAVGSDLGSELPASARHLFRLIQLLLDFALNTEFTADGIQTGHQIVPEASIDEKHRKNEIRKRYLAILKGDSGSLEALDASLSRTVWFLLDLDTAYRAAIRQGLRALLTRMDPQPVLEQFKGRLGIVNYQEACKEISRVHQDMVATPHIDIWDEFFLPPFRETLTKNVEMRKSTGSKEPGQ